jgi:hypothetical protein
MIPAHPLCFSMPRSASSRCDIGRCPTTSPVTRKEAPISSMYAFAFRRVKIRQSMHGFIADPRPCRGRLTISRYSSPFDTVRIGIPIPTATSCAAERHPFPFPCPLWEQVQNGEVKWIA